MRKCCDIHHKMPVSILVKHEDVKGVNCTSRKVYRQKFVSRYGILMFSEFWVLETSGNLMQATISLNFKLHMN